MPEPLHPPFASGALTIPRTLLRWLDISYQGGPLTRTMTYVTLPSFNISISWQGYSDIVGAYNFEAPNNFTVKSAVGVPNLSYTLCISYRVGTTTSRYCIYLATGASLPPNAVMYNGQPILKNFRFEIWSSSNGNAVQNTPIQFYTSVMGQQDYRYGVDTALVGDDGLVTNFSCPKSGLLPLPSVDLVYRLNASVNVTPNIVGQFVTSWIDSVNNINFVPTLNGATLGTDPFFSKDVVAVLPGGSISGTGLGFNSGTIAISFSLVAPLSTASIVDSGGGVNAGYNNSTNKITTFLNGVSNKTFLPTGIPLVLFLYPDSGYCEIYNLQSGLLIDSFQGSSNVSQDATIVIGPEPMIVWDVIMYQSDVRATGQYQPLKDYFVATYSGGFPLPLTFPSGSSSTTN